MATTAAVTNSFTAATPAVAAQVNTNFSDLVNWINTWAMPLDASKTFTSTPSGPAADPTTANQLARKAYVDARDDLKVVAATSASRPASPIVSSLIWETDKSRLRVWDGAAWKLLAGAMFVSASGTHTYASAGSSALTFATKISDTDTMFTAGGSTFTVPDAGMYTITLLLTNTAGVNFLQGLGGQVSITSGGRTYTFGAPQSDSSRLVVTLTLSLAAAGTISMIYTNGGTGSISFSSYVMITRTANN